MHYNHRWVNYQLKYVTFLSYGIILSRLHHVTCFLFTWVCISVVIGEKKQLTMFFNFFLDVFVRRMKYALNQRATYIFIFVVIMNENLWFRTYYIGIRTLRMNQQKQLGFFVICFSLLLLSLFLKQIEVSSYLLPYDIRKVMEIKLIFDIFLSFFLHYCTMYIR